MADFTERLPLTDGTNRVYDEPANPSMLGAALGFASGALDTYVNYKTEAAKDAAKRKEDQEKADKAAAARGTIQAVFGGIDEVADQTTNAARAQAQVAADMEALGDQVVAGVGGINLPTFELNQETGEVFQTGTTNINPAAERAAQTAGRDLTNIVAAIDQGRMPRISLNAAITGRVRRLLDQYPDQTEHILDVLRKTPAADTIFQHLEDYNDENDFKRERGQDAVTAEDKYRRDVIETARNAIGEFALTGGDGGGPMSDDELYVEGLRWRRQATELEQLKERTAIENTQRTWSREERKEQEEHNQQEIVRIISGGIHNDSAPLIKYAQSLQTQMLNDPNGVYAQQWEQLGAKANTAVNNWVENAVALAVQNGFKGDANTLRGNFRNQFRPLMDLFSGDFAVAKINGRALESVQTNLRLNVAQALPVFSALKTAGIDPTTMAGFLDGIGRNPELQKQLRQEVMGFNADFGRDRASTRLMNIVRVMRGERTLQNFSSPQERNEAIRTLHPTVIAVSKDYARGLGGDPNAILNMVGELSIATRQLTPAAGVDAHRVAANGIGSASVRQSLLKMTADERVDKTMLTATIQAVRAGNAQILNNLILNQGKLNAAHAQHKIQWDDRTGRFRIDDSIARRSRNNNRQTAALYAEGRIGGAGAAASRTGLAQQGTPELLEKWVNAANQSLDNIIELGRHDPTTPKGSEMELRRYYGQNIMPKSMQQANAEGEYKPDGDINKTFDLLNRGLDQITPNDIDVRPPQPFGAGPGERRVTNMQGKEIVVPDTDAIRARFAGKNSNFDYLVSRAAALGIDQDVVMRLGYVESGGDYGDKTNSIGATGPIQVVPKYHNDRAQRMFGKNVPELTTQQKIDVGLDYLKELYNKYGNWLDAASAYHSGGPVRTHGSRNDGGIRTSDYARLIG